MRFMVAAIDQGVVREGNSIEQPVEVVVDRVLPPFNPVLQEWLLCFAQSMRLIHVLERKLG